jgi:hypothetical protein
MMFKGLQQKILAGLFVFTTIPAWASVMITPVSYDMPNGGACSWTYYDDTYSGSGNHMISGSFLSGGLGQLTDGVTGVDYWADDLGSGHAYEWVGWQTNPTITFDMGEIVDLESFSVHVNNARRGGVTTFDTCTLTFSNNGTDFSDPIAYTTSAANRADQTARFIDILTPRTAQYVKADFTRLDQWIFLSEVQFAEVPEPATLTLLSLAGLALIRKRSFLR